MIQITAGTSFQATTQTFHNFTPASEHAFIYTLELNLNLLDFNPAYPKNPKTIGEIIRKARLDKNLQAKELAKLLSATATSVKNWERYDIKPALPHLRRLENVLGVKFPPEMLSNDCIKNNTTLGKKIKQKRLELRLSQKELAGKLKVSVDALADWETDRHKPVRESLEKLNKILKEVNF